MKITTLIAVFLVSLTLSVSAREATWVPVSKGHNVVIYYDPANIKKNGKLVSVWTLLDYSEPIFGSGVIYQSVVHYANIDCAAEMHTSDFSVYFSGRMGTGNEVHRNEVIRSQRIIPGSTMSNLSDVVCK